MVADRIIAATNPTTVLDVGAPRGLLVQALAARGATHVASTSRSTRSSPPTTRYGRLEVRSVTEPIPGRCSLITCIEVLEHVSPADAQLASTTCAPPATACCSPRRPRDFDEPTHINTQQTAPGPSGSPSGASSAGSTSTSTSSARWAVLFEKAEVDAGALVHRYESLLTPAERRAPREARRAARGAPYIGSLHDAGNRRRAGRSWRSDRIGRPDGRARRDTTEVRSRPSRPADDARPRRSGWRPRRAAGRRARQARRTISGCATVSRGSAARS